jgi:hypothetical protein
MLGKILKLWENRYLIILSIHIQKLEISGCDNEAGGGTRSASALFVGGQRSLPHVRWLVTPFFPIIGSQCPSPLCAATTVRGCRFCAWTTARGLCAATTVRGCRTCAWTTARGCCTPARALGHGGRSGSNTNSVLWTSKPKIELTSFLRFYTPIHWHPNNRIWIASHFNTMSDLVLNSVQFHAFQYWHPNGA